MTRNLSTSPLSLLLAILSSADKFMLILDRIPLNVSSTKERAIEKHGSLQENNILAIFPVLVLPLPPG